MFVMFMMHMFLMFMMFHERTCAFVVHFDFGWIVLEMSHRMTTTKRINAVCDAYTSGVECGYDVRTFNNTIASSFTRVVERVTVVADRVVRVEAAALVAWWRAWFGLSSSCIIASCSHRDTRDLLVSDLYLWERIYVKYIKVPSSSSNNRGQGFTQHAVVRACNLALVVKRFAR